jgi:hypothetical protein
MSRRWALGLIALCLLAGGPEQVEGARETTAAYPSPDHFVGDVAVVTGPPFSVVVWCNFTALSNGYIFNVFNSGALNNNYVLLIDADPGEVEWGAKDSPAPANWAMSTAEASSGAWFHLCGIEAAADERYALLAGGSKGSATTSKNPSGLDTTGINDVANSGQGIQGRIAQVAVFGVALTDDQVLQLSKGFHPCQVNPYELVSLWPMLGGSGDIQDVIGGATLAAINTHTTAGGPVCGIGVDD